MKERLWGALVSFILHPYSRVPRGTLPIFRIFAAIYLIEKLPLFVSRNLNYDPARSIGGPEPTHRTWSIRGPEPSAARKWAMEWPAGEEVSCSDSLVRISAMRPGLGPGGQHFTPTGRATIWQRNASLLGAVADERA